MPYKYGRSFSGKPKRASLNERPMLNKIRQRIAQLRAQLTPQDGGVQCGAGILHRTLLRASKRRLTSHVLSHPN